VSKRSLWRLTLTLLVCGICGWFFLPTKKIRLGLDLRGGVHFELEVQGQEALQAHLNDTRDRLGEKLAQGGTPFLVKTEGDAVVVEGVDESQKALLEKAAKETAQGYDVAISGGQARLTQRESLKAQLKDDANKRALQIIENRINQFGVAEPEITATGAEGNRIVVELPGVEEGDRERIKGLLSTPGRLELRMVPKGVPQYVFPTKEAAMAFFQGQLPPQTDLIPEPLEARHLPGEKAAKPAPGEEEKIGQWVLLQQKVEFAGDAIVDARSSKDPNTDANEVHFTLNREGSEANARVSEISATEGRQFAFVLDHKIVSLLSASEKIIGGSVRITGRFSPEQADDLALKLRSGSMRASMKFLEQRVVGPSLGFDSIKSGVLASAIGFLTIIFFMVLFYRWSGVNAIVALTVNVIVMLGLLGSFRAVITLPGIAGFALTIGMAVDANILIFERIKEELDAGRSVAMAIDAGFDRVFWTIVDSHVTQLAAALLLFIFGTGPVKGFAVSLTVGVIASLFTSIYISRFIYDWVLERHPNTKTLSIGHTHFFKGAAFDFMKYKGVALAISWGIIAACFLVVRPWKVANNPRIQLGMQFVGGNDMTVRFGQEVEQSKVRNALVQGGFPDAGVVAYDKDKGGFQDFAVKVKAPKEGDVKDSSAQNDKLLAIFRSLDPETGSLPGLNLEGSKVLADRLVTENPLANPGDPDQLRKVYEPIASQIVSAREKLPSGMYRSWEQLPQGLAEPVKTMIRKDYRLGAVSIQKNESFSPSISGEWTSKTLQAVFWAAMAILVYVMFRFTASYAVGGIVALIHDMLMALGLFALFGYEFNVPVVASFLTLMGYSMADTIVVFDRIRENSHKPEYRKATISQLVNDSINQTLSRTILTSLSVLFVSICLWLWGGPALRDLAFPLVVGVITGTYSSIYIASPVVVYWEKWFPPKDRLKQKHA
jgi:protein-export membrane protein SecD/preprotein translocase SecF subunit